MCPYPCHVHLRKVWVSTEWVLNYLYHVYYCEMCLAWIQVIFCTACWCTKSLVSISTLIHNKKQYKKSTKLKSLKIFKNLTHKNLKKIITNQGDSCASMDWCSGLFLLKLIYVLNFFGKVNCCFVISRATSMSSLPSPIQSMGVYPHPLYSRHGALGRAFTISSRAACQKYLRKTQWCITKCQLSTLSLAMQLSRRAR